MGLLCSLFSKTEISGISACVSAKSYSLTLYEFFNRQDLSAIETERNAVFYSKHTAGSPIQRFSVCGRDFCKSLRNRYKRHKKLLAIVSTFASREFVLVEVNSWRNRKSLLCTLIRDRSGREKSCFLQGNACQGNSSKLQSLTAGVCRTFTGETPHSYSAALSF